MNVRIQKKNPEKNLTKLQKENAELERLAEKFLTAIIIGGNRSREAKIEIAWAYAKEFIKSKEWNLKKDKTI